ncbi:thioredoxin [Actinomyces minihominis]|uniref:thioredoxin n=1 Tax=Actinomyces minihominis TaxID=2002838 RepID=UPI000C0794AD|nr:thioredoxin [Actinomyces minihominis]
MGTAACTSCGKKNRVPEIAKGMPTCGQCGSPLPWLTNASDHNFSKVVDTKLPVLVDLWAPWCGPCRMVAPILEKVSKKYAGSLKIVKVNVDDNPRMQARFKAMSIPTMVLLRDGKVVAKQVGALRQPQLEQWLKSKGVRTQ